MTRDDLLAILIALITMGGAIHLFGWAAAVLFIAWLPAMTGRPQ